MSEGAPYPLLMAPTIQARPWGGSRIRDVLGKRIPAELAGQPIGESWEVSAHPNGMSRVANGPLAGRTLAEAYALWGERLTGTGGASKAGAGTPAAPFPLLVKLIEVADLASVQVHPNDEQAARLEGYPSGKTEAWYILDMAPEAVVYVGFRAGTDRKRFSDALARGAVRETLEPALLAPGDCVLLEPGTVHACGKGVLLLEVQQSCDITYRVYDWDRVDGQGRKRELHVDKALEVIDFAARPSIHRAAAAGSGRVDVLTCRHFAVFEVRLGPRWRRPAAPTFSTLTLVRGRARLEGVGETLELRGGDTVLVPAGMECVLEGENALLVGAEPAANR